MDIKEMDRANIPLITRSLGMRTRRYRPTLIAVGLSCLCFFTLFSFMRPIQQHTKRILNLDPNSQIYNRTLGFGRIISINMPGRTDKRDALTLASSYSEFDVTWEDGVATADVPKKAIPDTWDMETVMNNGILGSWRAHLNVLAKIVSDRIETALILEDDDDWDYMIKDQLAAFGRGTRRIQASKGQRSPYGDEWDMLWLGHCRAGPGDLSQEIYFIHNDTTVPPVPLRHSLWRQAHILPEILSNDSRVVFKTHAAMCTYAYAVTLDGARKILASLSLGQDHRPFDVSMSDMCRQQFVHPFTCYSPYPPLFSSHRFAGSVSRDSDLGNLSVVARHPEFTWDIVYSMIQNVPRLASGLGLLKSQWPEHKPTDKSIEEPYAVMEELRTIDFRPMAKEAIKGVNTN